MVSVRRWPIRRSADGFLRTARMASAVSHPRPMMTDIRWYSPPKSANFGTCPKPAVAPANDASMVAQVAAEYSAHPRSPRFPKANP